MKPQSLSEVWKRPLFLTEQRKTRLRMERFPLTPGKQSHRRSSKNSQGGGRAAAGTFECHSFLSNVLAFSKKWSLNDFEIGRPLGRGMVRKKESHDHPFHGALQEFSLLK